MKINIDSITSFNKFLRVGIFIIIVLITIGGIIYLLQYGMQNFHLETTHTKLNLQAKWFTFVKAGIFLLIFLQITRVFFIAAVFYFSNKIMLSLMSLFIALTLLYSWV